MQHLGRSDILRLYRGDATKINEFEFRKTNSWCLFGPGIYLTSNPEVADSYRTKGQYTATWNPNFETSFDAPDMNAAKAEFHKRLLEHLCECHYKKHRITEAEEKAFNRTHRFDINDMIAEGTVEVKKQRMRLLGGKFEFQFDFKYRTNAARDGYITSFDFPRQHLRNNVIDIDAWDLDKGFLEIIFEEDLLATPWEGSYMSFLGTFQNPMARRDYLRASGLRLNWEKAIKVLKPYGIYGYRYTGGIRAGWHCKHDAYVLWDSDFVNQHKVERFR